MENESPRDAAVERAWQLAAQARDRLGPAAGRAALNQEWEKLPPAWTDSADDALKRRFNDDVFDHRAWAGTPDK